MKSASSFVVVGIILLTVVSATDTSFQKLDKEGHEVNHSPFAKRFMPLVDTIEPFSSSIADDAEKFATIDGFDRAINAYMEQNLFSLCVLIALYLPAVFLGRKLMEDRPAFDLKVPLILWNAGLALFSVWGTLYMVPVYYRYFVDLSWYTSVCTRWCYGYGAENYLLLVFTLSKIAEFVDTAFIVLRKKPLLFLHYYHHVTTVSYCVYSVTIAHHYGCYGHMFTAMNFFVHSFMYTYYGLSACGFRLPEFVATIITVLQIAQMIAGIAITVTLTQCPRTSWETVYSGGLLYGSFFVLFAEFFLKRYVLKVRGRSQRKEGPEEKKRM